jgi:hypothetical protein
MEPFTTQYLNILIFTHIIPYNPCENVVFIYRLYIEMKAGKAAREKEGKTS